MMVDSPAVRDRTHTRPGREHLEVAGEAEVLQRLHLPGDHVGERGDVPVGPVRDLGRRHVRPARPPVRQRVRRSRDGGSAGPPRAFASKAQ